MYQALTVTKDTITDCLPNAYATIGWSDTHLKNAKKEVKDAVEAGRNVIVTIRPMISDVVNDNGDAYIETLEVSCLAQVLVSKIADVETAVEMTCNFPTELHKHLREKYWSRKLTGFSKIKLKGYNFPLRDPADDYSLVDTRFVFTHKGNY